MGPGTFCQLLAQHSPPGPFTPAVLWGMWCCPWSWIELMRACAHTWGTNFPPCLSLFTRLLPRRRGLVRCGRTRGRTLEVWKGPWSGGPSGTKPRTPTCYCSHSLVLLTLASISLSVAIICCPYQAPPALQLPPKTTSPLSAPHWVWGSGLGRGASTLWGCWGWKARCAVEYGLGTC